MEKQYKCKTIKIIAPKNFIKYNFDDGYKDEIIIDACLSEEITSLWDKGIHTTGCCCGHGRHLGFIQVIKEDIPQMYQLGYQNYIYEHEFGGIERKDAFIPKTTQHIYDGYTNSY